MTARMKIEEFLCAADAPVSAADIAISLGLGRSTVSKNLAALEESGTAVRTKGGRDGGTRLPDLWSAPAALNGSESESAKEEKDASIPVGGENAVETSANVGGLASTGACQISASVTDPSDGSAESVNQISRVPRLQHGQLRQMVKAVLASESGSEFSPTEISHILRGRSVGAIQNCLARLVKDGEAELVCEAPRRYQTT